MKSISLFHLNGWVVVFLWNSDGTLFYSLGHCFLTVVFGNVSFYDSVESYAFNIEKCIELVESGDSYKSPVCD